MLAKMTVVFVFLGLIIAGIATVVVLLLSNPPVAERHTPKIIERGGEVLTPGKSAAAPSRVRSVVPVSQLPTAEQALIQKVRQFLLTDSEGERNALAQTIAHDQAYDPAKVRGWLHAAGVHKPLTTGLLEMQVPVDRVPIDRDRARPITIRIPRGYTPDRAWPVIMAYHPTAGTGGQMIDLLLDYFGPRLDDYVIVGPTNYRPTSVDSYRGVSTEHRNVLLHVKQTVHVDSDRVYAVGYSQGGYAAWSMATFYGDEFAASIPVACSFDAAPEVPGLWELMMPNVAKTPVLHVWGGNDLLQVLGFDLKTPQGTNAEWNMKVVELTERFDLNVLNYRVNDSFHGFEPPIDRAVDFLRKQRVQYPDRVTQRFRFLHQSRASWLEGTTWDGDQWQVGRPFPVQGKETLEEVAGRTIPTLLGRLDGKREGQTFTIEHEHLAEFVVWFGDDMLDWSKPVTVIANGKRVFEGMVARNLLLCLSEARRTFDFDRLRWARLPVSKDGSAARAK